MASRNESERRSSTRLDATPARRSACLAARKMVVLTRELCAVPGEVGAARANGQLCDYRHAVTRQGVGFERAVSRILSAPCGGENHLSERPIPGIRPLSRNWSGPLRDPLFGLAPDGVFHAVSLALHAVRSYRTFSPSPRHRPKSGGGLSVFCGTVRRPALKPAA